MNSLNSLIDCMKAEKMARGVKKYGSLNLQTDPRDFIEEARSELIDCLNYLEFAMQQGKIGFCKWFSIDRDIRFLIWKLERAGKCKYDSSGGFEG